MPDRLSAQRWEPDVERIGARVRPTRVPLGYYFLGEPSVVTGSIPDYSTTEAA